jgi:hypothetical protein
MLNFARPCGVCDRVVPDEVLAAAVSEAIGRGGGYASAADVACLVWACASLGWLPPAELMAGLAALAERLAPEMRPQQLANVAWGLSVLGQCELPAFRCSPPPKPQTCAHAPVAHARTCRHHQLARFCVCTAVRAPCHSLEVLVGCGEVAFWGNHTTPSGEGGGGGLYSCISGLCLSFAMFLFKGARFRVGCFECSISDLFFLVPWLPFITFFPDSPPPLGGHKCGRAQHHQDDK